MVKNIKMKPFQMNQLDYKFKDQCCHRKQKRKREPGCGPVVNCAFSMYRICSTEREKQR